MGSLSGQRYACVPRLPNGFAGLLQFIVAQDGVDGFNANVDIASGAEQFDLVGQHGAILSLNAVGAAPATFPAHFPDTCAMPTASVPLSPCSRFERVDALRAAAIVWMTLFHFSFDLNHFGFIQQNFYVDPFWTTQRSAIVSLFVFTAGLSQAVAVQQGQSWPRFWKRWAQLSACAVLVSAGSWVVYPRSWIYFGVLHGLALMLIVTRWLALKKLSTVRLLAFAGLALTLCLIVQNLGSLGQWPEVMNDKPFNWMGLNWRKPITEDFVPVLPWLGPMLLGLALGQWAFTQPSGQRLKAWLAAPVPAAFKPAAWLGGWSLSYYMLHQPVLFGVLWLIKTVSA
jgi:uncharacterized membrane protein